MTREEFKTTAIRAGLIGAPCASFQDNLDIIMDPAITVEFAGPVGSVQDRCYWQDGNGNGGCMSIPKVSEEKTLYIRFEDRNGVFKFSIPTGDQIPAGHVIGKGWKVSTEYRTNYRCTCGNYVDGIHGDCGCHK